MKNVFLIIFVTVLCFLTFSETKTQSLLDKGEIPKDLKITLERFGCLGTCPVYSLVIKADGSVLFDRKNFNKAKGKFENKITNEQIKQIIGEFKKTNFFSLKDRYITEKDGCKKIPPESPIEELSIKINGKRKVVSHRIGCGETALSNLADKIDEIVETKRWIGERK